MKEKGDPTQEEFRIVYALEGSIDLSTRHFMAFSPEEAMSMFEFVSKKNGLLATVEKIEKWNRWNSSWEVQDLVKDKTH